MKSELLTIANSLLWQLGIKTTRSVDLCAFESIFYRFFHEEFFFIQIGANDGVRADPIHKLVVRHKLKGLAVEPLGDMFSALQQTYRNHPQIALANLAIHKTEREISLHRVRPDADVGDWAHGIASINPLHHGLSGTATEHMIIEQVRAINIEDLIHTYEISRCDAFIVDTEGYDFHIIDMLLSTKLRPGIIVFEHGMLQGVMKTHEYLDLVGRLIMEGYFVITEEADVIAYKMIRFGSE